MQGSGGPGSGPADQCSSADQITEADRSSSFDGPFDGSGSSETFTDLHPATNVGAERWRNACLMKYCAPGGCSRSNCPFLHDLTLEEEALFKEITQNQQKHEVFDNSSSPRHSGSSSNNSPGAEKKQEEPSQDPELKERMEMEMRQAIAGIALPSRGSDKHASGSCKPCMYTNIADCAEGANCRFCHFTHLNPKIQIRQCKGKRERFKKLASRISKGIDKDPDCFDPERVEMPASVANNLILKKKLITLMTARAEKVRADRAETTAGSVGSGSGARSSNLVSL